ncbi:hypothetical protein ACK3BE_23250 [Pseudomonas mandelii]|jgi:hypothetical protein|uniref:hypothetical protein n=1 Tax=Pseudomonas mandelii TaxID=75612 RepID=UPI00398D1E8B
MTERLYRKLQGMELKFVSGVLKDKPTESAIGYSVTFRMSLDFACFVQMANAHIPGYLNFPKNAIRPSLEGFASHDSFNYLEDSAGKIGSTEELCRLFTDPENYNDQWSAGVLQRRPHKPEFSFVDGQLQVVATVDYRHSKKRPMLVSDLPVIKFQWALDLLQGHNMAGDPLAPGTVVILGYALEELVEAEGLQMNKGTRYMVGRTLDFGAIREAQILTAG